MFTDMVGYTALAQRDEFLSLSLLDENRKVLRPTFVAHNGKVIKTIGDAFLVEFSSALDAVRCAYDIQRKSREINISSPREKRFALRIGIHLGDVIEDSEGDILGDAVNVASRIQTLAQEGGVCLTQQVFDNVRNKFDLSLKSIGKQSLKNVDIPIEVYKMVMPWDNVTEEAVPKMAELDKKRIAVLPFVNMSADPADAYFADGMTEEVISTLSNIKELRVISRTSVMHYKNTSKKLPDIGLELNAGTVLEGSVRKIGNTVRITVQLVDTIEDRHLWARNYDRELSNVFVIQSEIAQQVADALSVQLVTETKERITKGSTQNTEAFTLYMKGLYANNQTDAKKAVEYFKLAIELDPHFAAAYAALSDCYCYLAGVALPEREAFPKAKQYALKAEELDSNSAEAHTSLAIVSIQYDWNWLTAESEFKRAIELNPSYSTAHQWFGAYLAVRGRFDEAISENKKAEELDPLSSFIKWQLGYLYSLANMFDASEIKCSQSIDLNPKDGWGHNAMGLLYIQRSMLPQAIAELETAVRLSGPNPAFLASLGYAYAISGRKEQAFKTIEDLMNLDKNGFVTSFEVAAVYLGLKEKDRALDYVEKAFEERDGWMAFAFRNYVFDSIRSEPRFVKVLQKMGLL
jgi:TolB-like protein